MGVRQPYMVMLEVNLKVVVEDINKNLIDIICSINIIFKSILNKIGLSS